MMTQRRAKAPRQCPQSSAERITVARQFARFMPSERELYVAALKHANTRVLRVRSRPATSDEQARQAEKLSALLEQYDGDLDRVTAELNRWCDEEGIP
jgi:hypothetical protein